MRENHRRTRYTLLTAVLLIAALLAGGCSGGMAAEEGDGAEKTVTMTPVELFEGDSKKFQPFLGSLSQAFKLRYTGDKPNAHLELAVWKNGERNVQSSISDLFFSGDGEGSREIEVIITEPAGNVPSNEETPYMSVKVGIFQDTGNSVSTIAFPRDIEPKMSGLLALPEEARTFPAEGTVYLWGMYSTTSNGILASEYVLTPEAIEKLEWALVLTVRFEE